MPSRLNTRFLLCLLLLVGLSALAVSQRRQADAPPQASWHDLFNGRDLSGWKLAPFNGKAPFRCLDGAIVGTTQDGEPITYLMADALYGDFVLDLEFLVPERVNTGIQFRSHFFPDCQKGHFHGYQVEIDSRSWTGGIFDEARRGWRLPLRDRPDLITAFLHHEWNRLRIEAVGNRIRTWLNGFAAADYRDEMTPIGYVAIQLHNSLHRSGDQIRFRNIRIQDLDRQANAVPRDPFLGSWKGATSNYSRGIYADVTGKGEHYQARLYRHSDKGGAPTATLQGRREGADLTLSGDGWSGRIRNGVFSGRGPEKALRPVSDGRFFEETTTTIPVDFVMIQGVFRTFPREREP